MLSQYGRYQDYYYPLKASKVKNGKIGYVYACSCHYHYEFTSAAGGWGEAGHGEEGKSGYPKEFIA